MARIKPLVYLTNKAGSQVSRNLTIPENIRRELEEDLGIGFTDADFLAMEDGLAVASSVYQTKKDAADHIEYSDYLEKIAASSEVLHELLRPITAVPELSPIERAKLAALRDIKRISLAEPPEEEESTPDALHPEERDDVRDPEFFEGQLSLTSQRTLLDRCRLDLSALRECALGLLSRAAQRPRLSSGGDAEHFDHLLEALDPILTRKGLTTKRQLVAATTILARLLPRGARPTGSLDNRARVMRARRRKGAGK